MKKHVLYILYDGLTENIPQSQVIPYLIQLSKQGYEFTILSFEKQHFLEERKALIQQQLAEHNIQWIIKSFSTKPPIVAKLWNVWQMKNEVAKLHKQKPISIVHCRSYMASLAGIWAKQTLGIKFLFDMRGFWADENKDMGAWKMTNPVFKSVYDFFKRKEKVFLEQSDAIVSLTEAGKTEINSWKHISIPSDKTTVIPCCVDTEHFDYHTIGVQKTAAIKQELGIAENAFVLSFLGTVGNLYMPDKMMRFFKLLLAKRPNSYFLFITTQDPSNILAAAAKENIPTERIKIKGAKRNEVPALLSVSDYSMFFIKPYYSKIASSPTKQGEIMALGIPIITNKGIGDTEKIVNESKAGYVVNEFSDSEFERIIAKMIETVPFDKAEIRAGAENFYSLHQGVKKYASIYKQLVG